MKQNPVDSTCLDCVRIEGIADRCEERVWSSAKDRRDSRGELIFLNATSNGYVRCGNRIFLPRELFGCNEAKGNEDSDQHAGFFGDRRYSDISQSEDSGGDFSWSAIRNRRTRAVDLRRRPGNSRSASFPSRILRKLLPTISPATVEQCRYGSSPRRASLISEQIFERSVGIPPIAGEVCVPDDAGDRRREELAEHGRTPSATSQASSRQSFVRVSECSLNRLATPRIRPGKFRRFKTSDVRIFSVVR